MRRAAGDIRYQQVSGGNIKGCLYLADTLRRGQPTLLTEGEFDALIVRQVGQHFVGAASIGSAGNRHIDPRWYRKFLSAPRILVRMDDDAAGRAAASEILSRFGAGRPVQVPAGKDINDFYLLADADSVLDWLVVITSG